MGIFVNRRFNLIYVHAALQALTSFGGEAFAFVYLLKAGIPVPVVLLSIGGLFGSRLLFRMLVLPLAKRMVLSQIFLRVKKWRSLRFAQAAKIANCSASDGFGL
jgi:hypothetical protein